MMVYQLTVCVVLYERKRSNRMGLSVKGTS
jgi:hypothetical protein